jgi:hypothetical protein
MSPLIAPELVGCCKNPVITLQPDQARSKQEPSAMLPPWCEIYIEGVDRGITLTQPTGVAAGMRIHMKEGTRA